MTQKENRTNWLLFIAFSFALNALLLIVQISFGDLGAYSLSVMQFSPALSLGLVWVIRRGRMRPPALSDKLRPGRSAVVFSAVGFAGLAAAFSAAGMILSSAGQMRLTWQTPSVALSVVFLLAGCFGEELGWRGFLLPALNRGMSLLSASLLTGLVWGLWHMYFEGGVAGFVSYIAFTVAVSVNMAWIQSKAAGCIIPAVVFHFSANLSSRLFLTGRTGKAAFSMLAVMLAVSAAVMFAADRKTFLRRCE